MPNANFHTAGRAVLLVAGLCLPTVGLAGQQDNWDKLSTALVLGVVGGAAVATFSLPDPEGHVQFLKTIGSTLVITEALKALVTEDRPDGSGNDSFPSGHTSLAFAAAAYFDIRYGDEHKGLVPVFYGAAALTAIGRVEAQKHYAQDVVAGALIGAGLAYAFTTQFPDAEVSVYPTEDGAGISFSKHF